MISETTAILRYLGRRGGLYPNDSLQALQVEYMIETITDALYSIELSCAGSIKSMISENTPWTEKELRTIRQRIAKDKTYGLPHVREKLIKNKNNFIIKNIRYLFHL